MAHTWLPSSPSVITAAGMLAHGRGISNCRLSTKKKKRVLAGGERLEGSFSAGSAKLLVPEVKKWWGDVSVAERGRKPLTSV